MKLHSLKSLFSGIAVAMLLAGTTFTGSAMANGQLGYSGSSKFQLQGGTAKSQSGFKFKWKPLQRNGNDFYSNSKFYGSQHFDRKKYSNSKGKNTILLFGRSPRPPVHTGRYTYVASY